MVVRRSGNPVLAIMKRLPHRAKFKREDPLRPSDRQRLEAMVRSIAAGGEYMTRAGSRGDEVNCTVIHFDCPEKAKAMQAWLDASDITNWPRFQPRTDIEQLKVGG
jgi:hypothetical protein